MFGSLVLMQLGAVLMLMAYITTPNHADVHGLCYHQKPHWCPWPVLPPKVMWMSVGCAAAWGHVDISGLSVVCTAARHLVDAHGLGCCWNLYWYPWSMLSWRACRCSWPVLSLKAIMVSVAHALPEGYVDDRDLYVHHSQMEVFGTCWCWRACGWLRSVLLPETTWKPVIHASAHYKGQGSYFCSGIDDYRCTVEKKGHRKLLWQPLLTQSSQK